MSIVRSRFKYLTLAFIILLSLLMGSLSFGTLFMLISNLNEISISTHGGVLCAASVFIGVNIFFTYWLIREYRLVTIEHDAITFSNPIIPALRKRLYWQDLDYYILVDEESRYTTHEAVWLMRNEKVVGRFSSFTYSNYDELKRQVLVEERPKVFISQFEQLFAIIGLKKVKVDVKR